MSKFKIEKSRRIEYGDEYSLVIELSRFMTAEDFKKVTKAIDTITKISDTYLDVRLAKIKEREKGGNNATTSNKTGG